MEPSISSQKLHHVGFVVASIRDVIDHFAQSVDGTWDGRLIHDPLQCVHVAFIKTCCPQDPMLELVEPAGENSPVSKIMKKGGGFPHLCYEADDLEKQLKKSREKGGLIVRPPLPAVAFDGRRIAWVYTPEHLLLEYLER